jgi:tetratricopeptide (TPR) repeat protein
MAGPTEQGDEGTLEDVAPVRFDLTSPIAGRYQLESFLGSGGMGVVYRAKDLERGTAVALKLVRVGLEGAKVRNRFEREIAALAAVTHQGVVRYLDHGASDDGATYLVMELVEGHDLAHRIARGRLSVEQTLDLAQRLAEALSAAHDADVVHRDLKPSNILLPDGVLADAKLLDFGIARLSGLTGLTGPGHVLGTPGYMSPEQARGDVDIDGRTDIYSLGCVLFECLTGEPPFPGAHAMAVLAKILLEDTPRVSARLSAIAPGAAIAPVIDELVYSMMARAREHRPTSPATLRGQLAQLRAAGHEPGIVISPAASLSHSERRVLSVLFVRESSVAAREAGLELGGEVIELVNGSVLVSFPGAETSTDQAEQAARCALMIRARQPSASIVLASGHGVIGRRSLIGEVIDRGAELVHGSRAGDIRLDESTAALLESIALIAYDDDGARLQGLRASAEPLRTLLGRPTPFVGRASELAALEGVIHESLTEPCANVALVLGEPGVGKSRLRYELLRRVSARWPDVDVLIGRADPVGADAAYGLIARALRAAAGVHAGLSAEQQSARFVDYLFTGSELPTNRRDWISAFLGELAGLAPAHGLEAHESARADPKLMREAIVDAWEAWLMDRCRSRGVLLVLEDLHWGDAGTLELVARTLSTLDELPFVVLAFARPELERRFASPWAEFEPHRVALEPLSRRAARKLAARVLTDASANMLDAMVERSGGNAFYLEELLRAAAQGEHEQLPDTVAGMVQSRLAQLEPHARRLLRAGAVFGEVCWSGGVARVVAEPEAAIVEGLDALAAQEFLTRRVHSSVPGTHEYTFRHALVRDAVYATLTSEDQGIAHGLAGRWLELAGSAEPAILAYHYQLGGLLAEAVVWFEKAAVAALDAEDHTRATKLVEAGLECRAEGEVLGRLHWILARIAEEAGEHTDAIERAQVALPLLREGSQPWYGTLAVLVESLGRTSRFEEIQPWLERSLAQAHEGDALDARAVVVAWGAMHLCRAGYLAIAHTYAERARELANRGSPSPLTRLRLLELEHDLADMAGDLGNMLRGLDEIAVLINIIDSPVLRARHGSVRGHLFSQLGVNSVAEAGFEVERAYAARRGLRYRLFSSLGMLAVLAYRRDDLDRSADLLAQARAVGTPDRRFIGVLAVLGSILALARGELDGALAEARVSEAALSIARPLHPYGLATLANALRARGELDDALEHAQRAMSIVDELGSVSEIEVDVQVAYLEALLAVGRRDEAGTRAQRFIARFNDRRAGIPSSELRESFSTGVPANVRLLELCSELRGSLGELSMRS